MALTQITYNDKSNYQSSSLANEYKVSASDMNEIKTVVNGICTQVDNSIVYSTTETAIGTWIDGRTIYRKVIDVGTFPNANYKNVAHGISNLDLVIHLWIAATSGTSFYEANMTGTSSIFSSGIVVVRATGTNIQVATSIDFSAHSGYAIIEYVKTS